MPHLLVLYILFCFVFYWVSHRCQAARSEEDQQDHFCECGFHFMKREENSKQMNKWSIPSHLRALLKVCSMRKDVGPSKGQLGGHREWAKKTRLDSGQLLIFSEVSLNLTRPNSTTETTNHTSSPAIYIDH